MRFITFRILASSLVLALAVCGPARAADPGEALSLDEAIDLALKGNPRVAAARQRVVAREGLLRSAKAMPALELLAVPFGTFNDNPLIFNQTFDVLGKRGSRSRSARSELGASTSYQHEVETTVVYDVTVAYLELQEAVEIRRLGQDTLELLKTLRTLAQQRFELGDVPKVQVTRTSLELDRAEQDLRKAAAQVDVKRALLNASIGRDPSIPVLPSQSLGNVEAVPVDLESLKRAARDARPDLKAARFLLAARRADVNSARSQHFPDLAFQARTGSRDGGTGDRLGLGLSLPIFDWGSISGRVKAAKATAAEQSSLIAAAELGAETEVETAFRRLVLARSVNEAYASRIIPDADSLARTLRLSYEQGGSTLLEVIDAQRTLAATRVEGVRAIADYRKALAELTRAVGGRLPPLPNNRGETR